MNKALSIILCVGLLCAVFAVQDTDRVPRPESRAYGGQSYPVPTRSGGPVPYRPADRQGTVLFVEDLNGAGFGPGVSPDPLWDSTLTHLMGTGNYGWFGPITDASLDGPDLATMQSYDLVIWCTYDYWQATPGLTGNDQTNIANYIAGGGKVWIIGQDLIYTGVPLSFFQTYFHLASVVEDYGWALPTINLAGQVELGGLNVTVTADYQSNDFFPDALTPDASAHGVVQDADSGYTVGILNNDFSGSFWVVDGRSPNPVATWEEMVYNMLDAFGIFAPPLYIWDFEDGWQGWTHTNGAAFPAGWSVEPSNYYPTWTPPDAGDSTFWIDSDDAGSGTWVQDTALSPVVVPFAGMMWMKWGVGYNWISAGEFLEVGIKYYDSGWNVVPLVTYTTDTGPMWDSANVSTYSSYDSVQVYFYYDDNDIWAWYAAFDNVSLYGATGSDIAVVDIASPPAGPVAPGDYDVIAEISNLGATAETFDVVATVYDTTDSWNIIFTQTITLTDFPSGADTSHNFGMATLGADGVFFTEVYHDLADDDPGNDTLGIFSRTQFDLGDIVFEMDVQTPTGDNQCLGVEFDGTYFYVTGGGAGADPNKVYVLDTTGTLIWTLDQPAHSTGWGWRDLAWDNVYAGPGRIDTLYASVDGNVDAFGIDLTSGSLDYYGNYAGPDNPNRALAWHDDSSWFFAANWDPQYKFSKMNSNIQMADVIPSCYGAAYDTDPVDGGWVWWHSQNDPGTGWACRIDQMEPVSMNLTTLSFGFTPALTTTGSAGGLAFYEGFRDMDVLFALVQGDPVDEIVGIFVRTHDTGIEDEENNQNRYSFGFAPGLPNPVQGNLRIAYTLTQSGPVTLKVYDNIGRHIQTLVSTVQAAGFYTAYWDASSLANGVYFLKLDAHDNTATKKMILVK